MHPVRAAMPTRYVFVPLAALLLVGGPPRSDGMQRPFHSIVPTSPTTLEQVARFATVSRAAASLQPDDLERRKKRGRALVPVQHRRATRRRDGKEGSERKTILLVDDSEAARHVMVRTLVRAGHQVVQASSGPEALALLQSHRSIDLLITNVQLQPGISGAEVAVEVLARKPGVPVLYVSGSVERPSMESFVKRSVDPGELLRRVDTLLGPTRGAPLPHPPSRKWTDRRDGREWIVRAFTLAAAEALSSTASPPPVIVPDQSWIVFRLTDGYAHGRDILTQPVGPELRPTHLGDSELERLLDLARGRRSSLE